MVNLLLRRPVRRPNGMPCPTSPRSMPLCGPLLRPALNALVLLKTEGTAAGRENSPQINDGEPSALRQGPQSRIRVHRDLIVPADDADRPKAFRMAASCRRIDPLLGGSGQAGRFRWRRDLKPETADPGLPDLARTRATPD